MLGPTIALLCALCWSISLILLKTAGAQVHPIVLNLGKNVLGLLLFIPTVYLVEGGIPTNISFDHYTLLLISGFIGIGIADALTLRSMTYLTATGVALLECLFAPFVIILSIMFLGESLSLQQGIGGLLIAVALFFVLPKEQSQPAQADQPASSHSSRKPLWGVVLMGLGLFTMAVGIIMIKPVYEHVPLFSIITIRMAAGVLGSILVFALFPGRRLMLAELWHAPNKLLVYSAFITSSYIAITLWIAGYKYLQASVAAVLNQTSTIFTVILAVVILKEQVTLKKVVATLLATAGVIIISVH
ncbi:MAG: DMT family transporter [Oligoflexus sp.]